jgi:hypothetical protein
MITYKEYLGKKICTESGNINGHGIELPIYQRDLLEGALIQRGVSFDDLRKDEYNSLSCKQLQELVDTAAV